MHTHHLSTKQKGQELSRTVQHNHTLTITLSQSHTLKLTIKELHMKSTLYTKQLKTVCTVTVHYIPSLLSSKLVHNDQEGGWYGRIDELPHLVFRCEGQDCAFHHLPHHQQVLLVERLSHQLLTQ